MYLDIITIMLTSSLSVFNCFISKEQGKTLILGNQNSDMKSKKDDEGKDAIRVVLWYFVSTVTNNTLRLFLCNIGEKKTTLFKNALEIQSSVQHSTEVHSDSTFKCAWYKSILDMHKRIIQK